MEYILYKDITLTKPVDIKIKTQKPGKYKLRKKNSDIFFINSTEKKKKPAGFSTGKKL